MIEINIVKLKLSYIQNFEHIETDIMKNSNEFKINLCSMSVPTDTRLTVYCLSAVIRKLAIKDSYRLAKIGGILNQKFKINGHI